MESTTDEGLPMVDKVDLIQENHKHEEGDRVVMETNGRGSGSEDEEHGDGVTAVVK